MGDRLSGLGPQANLHLQQAAEEGRPEDEDKVKEALRSVGDAVDQVFTALRVGAETTPFATTLGMWDGPWSRPSTPCSPGWAIDSVRRSSAPATTSRLTRRRRRHRLQPVRILGTIAEEAACRAASIVRAQCLDLNGPDCPFPIDSTGVRFRPAWAWNGSAWTFC